MAFIAVVVFGAVELMPGNACTAYLGRDAKGAKAALVNWARGVASAVLCDVSDSAENISRNRIVPFPSECCSINISQFTDSAFPAPRGPPCWL